MSIGRRDFLSGLAAMGAGALLADSLHAQQALPPPTPGRRIIDVHYHYSSPMYREVLRPMGTGQTPIIEWDDRKAVEDMDRYGVQVSMLYFFFNAANAVSTSFRSRSPSSPGSTCHPRYPSRLGSPWK